MPVQLVLAASGRVGPRRCRRGGRGVGVEEVGRAVLAKLSLYFFAHEVDGQFGVSVLVAPDSQTKRHKEEDGDCECNEGALEESRLWIVGDFDVVGLQIVDVLDLEDEELEERRLMIVGDYF
jgi:hypothetical protein